ncbi:gliding motility-associated C-terminal domain-containing protein [Flavobacteriales bacterium]|nr:gliding motility-associated C-terminal domain-containing protein [Flavobacteriales bacterium]
MKKLIFLFFIIQINSFSQTISIGYFGWSTSVGNYSQTIYENTFGVGNVNFTDYSYNYNTSLATLQQHDVIILNLCGENTIPKLFADNLVILYENNKHLILSNEGSKLITGEKISSYVWNKITIQSITETIGGAIGTGEPPRFHPSKGPGGLSQNNRLTGSTTTYSSFGNLFPMNVIHQRTKTIPDCKNIEGLDALYPHIPKINEGTIYINGECVYPYISQQTEVKDLARNLAILHHTLLTNNQSKLKDLNKWSTDPSQQLDFSLKKEDIKISIPNDITPNNDGENDIFNVQFKSHNPIKIDLKIYNRWGNIVYSSKDLLINWNGKEIRNNFSLSEGVYFYSFKATFENECKQFEDVDYTFDYKGNISIFR